MTIIIIIIIAVVILAVINAARNKKDVTAGDTSVKQSTSSTTTASSTYSSTPSASIPDDEDDDHWTKLYEEVQRKKKEAANKARREARKMTPAERKKKKMAEQAKEIFRDGVSSITDYSHLTPEQAERKLERMKEEEGWVADEDYIGLKRIIEGNYPIMEIPENIVAGSDADLEVWFRNAYDTSSYGISKKVFKYVADRLKPYHEAMLLKEMDSIEPVALETWMAEQKEQGKFFSNKVYAKLRKKWLSQYDF